MFKFLLLLLFSLPSLLYSQSQRITDLESELRSKRGDEYVIQLLQLAHLYLEEAQANQSLEKANLAESAAKRRSDKEFRAQALNLQGHALLAQGQTKNSKPAWNKFKRSLKFLKKSKNHNLAINNLDALIVLAEQKGDSDDVQGFQKQILEWEAKSVKGVSEEEKKKFVNVFFKNKKIKNIEVENKDLSARLETLDVKTSELAIEKEQLYLEKIELDLHKEKLDELIELREQKIVMMNEEQAKTELRLIQQKSILDSLRYRKMIDQFKLEKQDLMIEQREVQLKEQNATLELQRSQRKFLFALATLGILLAIGLFTRYLGIKKHNVILETKNQMIREEQERSEQLLLNILPATIANELKSRGQVETVLFEKATVLFSDFKDFSAISKKLSPKQLVTDLDYCFKAFDKIIGKYRLEKIKTIGDAYMCAGGIPNPKNGHPVDVVQAALEIQTFLKKWKAERMEKGEVFFEARVGIHTGPLIAGVVGDKKFAYDIWGDTVNIAARMETCSIPGKVNISQMTYLQVKDHFSFNARGKVPAKNIGEVEMFFVEPA